MNVVVNGAERLVDDAIRVAQLVESLAGRSDEGVAVAVNGEVVPRSQWHEREVQDGDEIEIVRAVQGG